MIIHCVYSGPLQLIIHSPLHSHFDVSVFSSAGDADGLTAGSWAQIPDEIRLNPASLERVHSCLNTDTSPLK